MVGARAGSPLVVGVGEGENFLASDALALLPVTTERIAYLEEGDVADIDRAGWRVVDADGQRGRRARCARSRRAARRAELGPYRHFMQKEIFEQPRAVADTLESVAGDHARAVRRRSRATVLGTSDAVLILACGTSYYAGLVARYWIEQLAGIPCNVEIASEYRYRESVPGPDDAGGRRSRSRARPPTRSPRSSTRKSLGQRATLAICNVASSALMRLTRLQFLTHAGVEIGVASTKAFTTQLAALFLLALTLAKLRGRLRRATRPSAPASAAPPADGARRGARARAADHRLGGALREEGARAVPRPRPALPDRARRRAQAEGDLLHPRRGLPGGRAQARAARAGRPREMPVVTVAPNDALLEKLKSNMQEVRARGGELYVFADADTTHRARRRRARRSGCPSTTACCRRSCTWCRCSCSPTTPRSRAAPTSTSRETWRNRSRWNNLRPSRGGIQ